MPRQPVDPAGPGRLGPLEVGATRRRSLDAYADRRDVPLAEAVRELLDIGLAAAAMADRDTTTDSEETS